jgi:hypothetical protein
VSELPRIAFVHIPKAGGTSLISALLEYYPKHTRALYRHRGDSLENLSNKQLIAGHFGYDFARTTGAQLVTILRHPAERVISVYYYWRRLPVEKGPHARAAKALSLEQFLQSNDRNIVSSIRNAQVWQIAHAADSASRARLAGSSPRDVLERAKENLERFLVVGVIENPVAVAIDFYKRTGIALRRIRQLNATRDRPNIKDLPEETRRLIAINTRLDLQLYRFAVARFDLLGRAPRAGPAPEEIEKSGASVQDTGASVQDTGASVQDNG